MRGRHVRPPAHAVRAGARRRRARPPEDQVRHQALREDGGASPSSASSATSTSAPTSRTPSSPRYHAVIYACGAQTDRHMGIPGEDLPGQPSRHRVRGLVQRPPRFRRPRVRPRLRARRGHRQRQRGDGRGADARGLARPDRHHRHRRPRDRRARRERARGGARRRPPRARPGRLHQPRAARAPRAHRRRRDRGPRRRHARPLSQRALDEGELRQDRRAATSRSSRSTPQREPEGEPKRIALRFLLSPVEIQGDGKVEAIVLARNELYRDGDGRLRAQATGDQRRSSAGWCCARSATAACRSRVCPSTSGTARSPTRRAA